MADHHMLVFTNPLAGREAEFNKWYDEIHIPEVLAVKGFTAAQRYVGTTDSPAEVPPGPRPYMAVYEIEGDVNDAFQNMMAAVSSFNMGDSLDNESSVIHFYSPIGERQQSK